MAKQDMLQRGNKANNGNANGSDYLTDEQDGYPKAERERISADLTELYLSKKFASLVDILLDIQKRLMHLENLVKANSKAASVK